MMRHSMVRLLCLAPLLLVACGGSKSKGPTTPDPNDDAVIAVKKRASFDLGCTEDQVKITQLQEGSMMTAASYGASCGEKRASYIERMGTVIRQ